MNVISCRIQPNQSLVTKGNSLLDVKGVMSKD